MYCDFPVSVINICAQNPCDNGGICTGSPSKPCDCLPGWSGTYCRIGKPIYVKSPPHSLPSYHPPTPTGSTVTMVVHVYAQVLYLNHVLVGNLVSQLMSTPNPTPHHSWPPPTLEVSTVTMMVYVLLPHLNPAELVSNIL